MDLLYRFRRKGIDGKTQNYCLIERDTEGAAESSWELNVSLPLPRGWESGGSVDTRQPLLASKTIVTAAPLG